MQTHTLSHIVESQVDEFQVICLYSLGATKENSGQERTEKIKLKLKALLGKRDQRV